LLRRNERRQPRQSCDRRMMIRFPFLRTHIICLDQSKHQGSSNYETCVFAFINVRTANHTDEHFSKDTVTVVGDSMLIPTCDLSVEERSRNHSILSVLLSELSLRSVRQTTSYSSSRAHSVHAQSRSKLPDRSFGVAPSPSCEAWRSRQCRWTARFGMPDRRLRCQAQSRKHGFRDRMWNRCDRRLHQCGQLCGAASALRRSSTGFS
jgi:hypothetical protein